MGKRTTESESGTERVNLKTLAELLQLSQTTISLVLNDSPAAKSIPAPTRERVFEAARKFNYRPNYFARSLRQSRSMSIAVLAPDLSEGYFTLVMNGVQAALIEAHYFYFTASHYWQPELIKEYPRRMMERAVDGFLLLNTHPDFQTPLPVVAISAHTPSAGVTNLVLDHRRGAELALAHLHDLGHRQIAMMKGPEIIPDSEYRWSAMLEVAQRYGIETGPELQLQIPAYNGSPESGYLPVARLLERTTNFTAIFCFNDIAAIGAIRALKDAGLRVPEDVSVIGFDDILGASYHTPSLTTVRQPLEEMGREGARMLLQRIANPAQEFPDEIVLQPQLIARESTGAVKREFPAGKTSNPGKTETSKQELLV
ncbi:Maltose operon transcriptional repressor MalR, LacI family [Acidisarcina polymorpha]|uniref:Maltose operon transcriptional repressor MalR, LacI family n=1 Tax=Acidisarcina polymorpha TaxID=2211140 RepID=A0A2Z5G7H6_9BACT|nr:LacI family DNA-binding transcriptional regulator [Acidisarcina polymorpha]AXC15213.1 Maltose operon transcriptional repressor MalR, LacI family [Acidisarcina polymorpha]